MGEVFLAEDRQLERKVALKFLPEALADDPVACQRFEREAKSAAALDHPFICKIHEIAEVDGKTCIVMEHVSGQTVAQVLADGPLEPSRALEIAAEVVEALQEAHARRILHRDLKPGNLMLTEQGHIKVMDFGLAKRLREPGTSDNEATTHGTLTGTGSFVGTPAYMAPEQILGGKADERSDVFSFGVVLYELLGGSHPFRKETTSDTLAAIVRDPPTPPTGTANPTTYAIFDKLLAKEPGDRHASFAEVHAEVRRLRDSTSGLTPAIEERARGRRTPYVGREAERAELYQLVDQAIRGRGGLMLIGGEPGVGKTRLGEQVLAHAHDRRCLALTGRCYEMEGTPPFVPFVEMLEQCTRIMSTDALKSALGDAAPEVARLVPDLRRQFPDMPSPLELRPDQQQRYLFKNVTEFLERASHAQCIVFLLDDLQWADTSTTLLLQHLAPQLEHVPMLILGTYRDVELTDERPFARTLEVLTRQRLAQRTTLHRLVETDVGAMLAALGGPSPPHELVNAVYKETQGNPFFVEEVYQHLSDERAILDADGRWRPDLNVDDLRVPEGVRLVIGRRLERVGDETRRMLTIAAIIGRSFGLEVLEAIGDVTGDRLLDALEEAERTYLIMPSSSAEARWEFSHALIRQTLAESLSVPRRQRLHLRVADAIEKAAASPEAHASDIAHHLQQAGSAADPPKTVRYLTLAGDQALEAGAFDEALRRFNAALSIHDEDDQRQLGELRHRNGRALRSLGRWEEAIEEWQQALSISDDLRDPTVIARICRELVGLLIWTNRATEVVATTRHVLEVLGPEASTDRCRLLAFGGWGLALGAERSDELMAADEMLSQSLSVAETLGDPAAHGAALMARAYNHWFCMRRRDQADTAQRAAALLRSAGDLWEMADALAIFQMASVFQGRFDAAARVEEETETLTRRLGHMGAALFAQIARGQRDWHVGGSLDQFEAYAQGCIDLCARADMAWGAFFETNLALANIWRGRWDDARTRAREVVSREPAGCFLGYNWSMWFLCECLLGHKEAALALLEERRSHLPRTGRPNTCGAWTMLFGVVEGLATLNQREAAAELYPATVEATETGALMSWMPCFLLQRIAGIAAASGAQWEQAETHYQTALKQAHEIPFRSEQPEVRRWYAQMLVDRNAAGDRDKARTMLTEAVEMYQQIGMPRHLELAKDTLKDL